MYTLYYSPLSCSSAIHMALEKTGVDFSLEKINFKNSEHRQEPCRPFDHRKKAPLLRHGTVYVDQGAAILLYLADLHPEIAMIPPAGGEGRSAAISMLFYLSNTLHPAFLIAINPEQFTNGQPDEVSNRAVEKIETILTEFDERLEAQDFLMGCDVIVADYYLVSMLNWLQLFQKSLALYPNLATYQKRMIELPEVESVLEKGVSEF